MRELEPRCRTIGRYRFTASPGLNRLRLPSHVGSTKLGVGTYALVGKTLPGRKVFDVVATVHRKHGRFLARVRHISDATCTDDSSGVAGAAYTQTVAGGAGTTGVGNGEKRTAAPRSDFTPPTLGAPQHHKSPLVRAATFDDAPPALRPLLYALLAISIGLLTAAALPSTALPAGAPAAFVTARRGYLAAVGIWLLVVVAVIAAVA